MNNGFFGGFQNKDYTKKITYNNINLTSNEVSVTAPGVYRVTTTATGSYSMRFENPTLHEGEKIVILNSNSTSSIPLSGSYLPVDVTGSVISNINPSTTIEFIAIEGVWYKLN